MIDTHCHIHSEEFDTDRGAALQRARAQGVVSVLTMGEDFADNQRVLDTLADARPGDCARPLACLGLHPQRIEESDVPAVIDQIRTHADELVAIGEVGLDFWSAKEDEAREGQRATLRRLAELALELDLPLSIHSRSAGHHAIDLLAACGVKRVCMHAFDGAAKHAERAYEHYGYYFSVPPSVLRSPQKQKLVRRLPLAALLLESDAPVLGPDRERRNEPANIVISAQTIAEIKQCSLDAVIEQTTANAEKLFRLPA